MEFKYCTDSNPQPPRAQATRSGCKTCCSDENKFLFYNLQKNHSLPSSKTLWFIFEVCRANLDNNLVYYNMQGAPLKMVSKASITVFLKSFCLEGLIFARLCPFFLLHSISRFIDYCYVNVRSFPISEYLCKHCKEIFVIIGFGK